MYSLSKTCLTMDDVVVNLSLTTLRQIRSTCRNLLRVIGPVVGPAHL